MLFLKMKIHHYKIHYDQTLTYCGKIKAQIGILLKQLVLFNKNNVFWSDELIFIKNEDIYSAYKLNDEMFEKLKKRKF